MMEAEQIARKLTAAQREAVCGRYSWGTPHEEDVGETELYALGIWNPRPKYSEGILTPLGLAVRAAIERKPHDH